MDFFKNDNLGCKCGKCSGDQRPEKKVMDAFNVARYHAGVPFIVASAYRCPLHPDWSENHEGWAMDIAAATSSDRFKILNGLLKAGFKRIGISYKKGFIHADMTPGKPEEVIWGY